MQADVRPSDAYGPNPGAWAQWLNMLEAEAEHRRRAALESAAADKALVDKVAEERARAGPR